MYRFSSYSPRDKISSLPVSSWIPACFNENSNFTSNEISILRNNCYKLVSLFSLCTRAEILEKSLSVLPLYKSFSIGWQISSELLGICQVMHLEFVYLLLQAYSVGKGISAKGRGSRSFSPHFSSPKIPNEKDEIKRREIQLNCQIFILVNTNSLQKIYTKAEINYSGRREELVFVVNEAKGGQFP